jgi:Homeodomain-like domain
VRVVHHFGKSDFQRTQTITIKGRVSAPEWAMSDDKVRRVVAFHLRAVLRIPNGPNDPVDLATCRELDRRVMEKYQRSTAVRYVTHFETLTKWGGPLSYWTSMIYRRYRLNMSYEDLGEKYGLKFNQLPGLMRKFNRVAHYLFGAEAPVRKIGTIDVSRVLELHSQGLSVRKIADAIAWSRPSVEQALLAKGQDWQHRKPALDTRRALELRRRGMSYPAIGRKLGCSDSSVWRALRKLEERSCS